MNSRERVQATLNKKPVDKSPCGLGASETSSMHLLAYDRLQKLLGLEPKTPRLESFMCNAVFEPEVLKAFGCDILLIDAPHLCKSRLWGNNVDSQWKEQELWGKKFKIPNGDSIKVEADGKMIWETIGNIVCPKGGYFFDSPVPSELMGDFNFPDPDDYNPPHDFSDEYLRELENTAKNLYETTDFSLSMGEAITDLQVSPGGMIGSMVLMMEEPDVMKAFLRKALDAGLAQLKLLEQAIGKYVDIVMIAQDFGDNRGLLIGPDLWREIYKPFYKEFFTRWHEITSMKVSLHSCGSIYEVMPDLIECGLDIYNPVQISAANMSPENLKSKFGNDIIFFGGGYDAQLHHPTENYDSVYESVRKNIEVFSKDGGFIFAGVHNLPADVPDHHLLAFINAWKDYRNS